MEEEKRILDPLNTKDALEIIMQNLGVLTGVHMRTVWKAFETIESEIKEEKAKK